MKSICLLIISVLFLAAPANIFASSNPFWNNRTPLAQEQTEQENTDKKNNDNNGKGNNRPIPTVVISKAPVQPTPTQVPANETKKPTPIPTDTKPAPTSVPERSTTNQTNTNPFGVIVIPQDKDKIRGDTENSIPVPAVNTRRTVTPTPAILGTNQRVAQKENTTTPKQNQQTTETPLKKIQDIIAPPLASVAQVKGANYYQDERLSPLLTANLLYFALGLFLTGMFILKLPLLKSGIDKMRQRFGKENADTFTVPYIETK